MTIDCSSLLGTVDEFVFNDDKIVTYKWISNELKIHANTAKQLLYSFATKESVNGKLLVTYIVSGINEDGSQSVNLVSSKDLDRVKGLLKRVISEHVYSVQNVSLSPSVNNFYNVDKEACSKQEKRDAPIQINSDIIRKEIQQSTVQLTEKNPKIQPEKNPNFMNKSKTSEKTVSPVEKNESSAVDSNQVEGNKSITETHNGTNISPQSNNKNKTSPKKADKKVSKKNVPLKGGGIGAFFSKQTAEKSVQKSKSSEAGPQKNQHIEETENIPNNCLGNGQKVKKESSEAVIPMANDKQMMSQKKQDKSLIKKRKNSSKSNGKNRKKMKRIMIASDSDSSSEEMEAEEEEAPPPPVSPEPVANPESDEEIIPPTPIEKGKKRVRKEVDQVTTTDDGFILTKKEYVYISTSDEENEPKAKLQKNTVPTTSPVKSPVSPRKTKKKSPKKMSSLTNKQSSIMSFFSRK